MFSDTMGDKFLQEGRRSNFQKIEHIGPYKAMHTEPTEEEVEAGCEQAYAIKRLLLSKDYVESFCGQIFNYRINISESLIENLYEFFFVLLYKDINLHYSPQFGVSLWVHQFGFQRYKPLENILQKKTYIFFQDYIFENSTFIRYHYEYRFDTVFDFSFRKAFLHRVTHTLLAFADAMGRKYLFASCLRNALNMIEIKIYS